MLVLIMVLLLTVVAFGNTILLSCLAVSLYVIMFMLSVLFVFSWCLSFLKQITKIAKQIRILGRPWPGRWGWRRLRAAPSLIKIELIMKR